MIVPIGFKFAGVHAGLKPSRRDLALVFSELPCAAAGCFTRNAARAAPVLDAERRVPAEGMRALVINSGNANALMGPEGDADVQVVLGLAAEHLGIPRAAVLTASTGVIGRRLPVNKLTAAFPKLVDDLRSEPDLAAEAILTTDTVVKMAARSLELGGRAVILTAIAKGSGMIAPSLATMIAAVVTDCAIEPSVLTLALRAACEGTFNCLTVDGDMSTNDCIFALANGAAGNPKLSESRLGSADFATFQNALTDLCDELARAIAADGEGATKLLTVRVSEAPSQAIARDLARAIAGSSLVKAALFGADPNWGRVMAAAGARAGSANYPFEVDRCRVTIQGMTIFEAGRPQEQEAGLATLKAHMRAPEIEVRLSLGNGDASGSAYGCDLSYDYVKINADYTSLIVQSPGGAVVKDDRLENYTPSFKVSILLEVLSYIGRLKGQRCVVKYGGAAMVKDSLKKSFCDDLSLLHSLGLRPVVVHGGGPEITRTLEKLGHKSEFIDGRRVTSSADLKVVEMVLTGSINAELVTLLNRDGPTRWAFPGKTGPCCGPVN